MEDLTTISIIAGITIALIKLLEKGIDLVSKQFGKGDKDNNQEVEIALLKQLNKIECNDLVHIKIDIEAIKKEYVEMKMMLVKIMTKLDIN